MKQYLSEFENPGADFRGQPFWAWNNNPDQEELLRQIDCFDEMGLGGFTIHCRTGLSIPYLGEEFMKLVKACMEKARQKSMKVYLYDEDRWPSGFGGGKVTMHPEYRAQYLAFSNKSIEELKGQHHESTQGSHAVGAATGSGILLARYDITLVDGRLAGYKMLEKEETGENVWNAYLEVAGQNAWFNNQSYVNTLDKKAVEYFLKVTHEVYYKEVGEEFGKLIPSIFTDEPQFTHKKILGRADDLSDVILPYTFDFEESFQKEYGASFLKHLPEVFWELPKDEVSLTRYRYHDHLAERFARAFSDTVGSWCREHGIKLTGHMMEEPTLYSQTAALGEAMRHYRGFDVPGIDMLCDWREYTTAKQAQSAAWQMGRDQITSELYGVTNWDFDFRGHKQQGDWQAALGVTNRVHHLSWVSMEGEAKRDYPASIHYQSPWYQRYHFLETYFARINTVLRSGSPKVRIGVIHPIESYWLYFGPEEQTGMMRDKLQKQFEEITDWLLFGLMDFHYIAESLLEEWGMPDESLENDRTFRVGEISYDVILVPGCITLRSHTVKRLELFQRMGGRIIFLGEAAKYIGAQKNPYVTEFAAKCESLPFDEIKLLDTLSPFRLIDMRDERGKRSREHICQVRELLQDRIVFIANAVKTKNPDVPNPVTYTVILEGYYQVTRMDPMTGSKTKIDSFMKNGKTYIKEKLYEQDSLLYYLSPVQNPAESNGDRNKSESKTDENKAAEVRELKPYLVIRKPDSYGRSEPNVLLLDQAEYSLDQEEFCALEEVLRIDNIVRQRLSYPLKLEAFAQPWTQPKIEKADHELCLRYTFISEIKNTEVSLAIERPQEAKITFNKRIIKTESNGYFTDKSIRTIPLGSIKAGENELLVTMPYHKLSNLEWCYLLGEFGVNVYGSRAVITALSDEIGFGDLVLQKHPFYAGNLWYDCTIAVEEGEYELEVSKFRAPLLSVCLDGRDLGNIAFSPYRISLGRLCGKHQIRITSYGSRINAFGCVHNCDDLIQWYGPEAWRSSETSFSYEYQLKKIGILTAPRLWKKV